MAARPLFDTRASRGHALHCDPRPVAPPRGGVPRFAGPLVEQDRLAGRVDRCDLPVESPHTRTVMRGAPGRAQRGNGDGAQNPEHSDDGHAPDRTLRCAKGPGHRRAGRAAHEPGHAGTGEVQLWGRAAPGGEGLSPPEDREA